MPSRATRHGEMVGGLELARGYVLVSTAGQAPQLGASALYLDHMRPQRRISVRFAADHVGVRLLAACAALILVSGCGAGRETVVSGVTVLISPRAEASADAALTGRLTVVGGCLGVGDAVVLWPYGTKVVDEDPLAVKVPGSGVVGVGEKVDLGGGVVALSGRRAEPGRYRLGGLTVPARCAKYDLFEAG